jgi:hypothetical protein
MSIAIWACLFLWLAAALVRADMIRQNVGLTTLRVGAFCNRLPDGSLYAPKTRDGVVDIFDTP